ncbi:hypothetical protein Pst134EA_000716 [Puccinia striiformis f. sp. tritici]|uniref:hypothetical protein n=1 Tax=Puccinia striiformis f. sp. tritici TaxID=168172 RepID=UPI0020089BFC|nr:hypothetical protein Pst134EA_000716 [Puccinia striiformis f. sp. tritici]KAH9473634.1 hypothetical protein Pst134EA_000716 [Puccinia striiformis f. sp. tritici]
MGFFLGLISKLVGSLLNKPKPTNQTRKRRTGPRRNQQLVELPPPPITTTRFIGDPSTISKHVAIDCEMVGLGPRGSISTLARVSIVDFNGNLILDRYVNPGQPVTDYRTFVSGIKPHHLAQAGSFRKVTQEVARLIDNKILIGHAVHHDLSALSLHHPQELIRDTSTYTPLWLIANTKRSPSLKNLARLLLNLHIQKQSHCSIDDAKATMAIYRTQQSNWEKNLNKKKKSNKNLIEGLKREDIPLISCAAQIIKTEDKTASSVIPITSPKVEFTPTKK